MADIETETKKEKKTFLQNVYNKGCDILETSLELGASYHLGQNVIKQIERVLWTLEKSALWSVPTPPPNTSKQQETNGTFGKPAPLVRPLPWILFLPLLTIMRMIRVALNMGAVFVGADSVKPTTVVKFIQVRRRRLRVIKYRGLRKMAIKKTNTEVSNDETSTWRQRIYNTLRGAMCVYPKHTDTSEKIIHAVNSNDLPAATVKTEQKRKHDDMDSNSEGEDPEYLPSGSDSDDASDSESDDERDEDEPVCDAKPLLKRPSSKTSLTAEVIKEENEDSDSSTASAESNDTQKRKESTTASPDTVPASPKLNDSASKENHKLQIYTDGITSDEFFSPEDSECPSPEPKVPVKCNITKNDLSEPHYDTKIASQNLIATEQVQKNMNGSNIAMAKGKMEGNHTGNNRSHGKRKNKKKISNPFNRRRK